MLCCGVWKLSFHTHTFFFFVRVPRLAFKVKLFIGQESFITQKACSGIHTGGNNIANPLLLRQCMFPRLRKI